MNQTDLLKPLEQLLVSAQELVQLAHVEDWAALDVAAKKHQHNAILLEDKEYQQAIKTANLVDKAKDIILKIQHVNDELDICTNLQREKIASELRLINQSSKALSAYGR